ncbi:DNA polymerase I [Shumkonia mesophila]|uniref:DNA polymerase I n=1 Tax=Shumkonia mesophila TaxID=2838854 RepID=UPI0029342591|nr:DNA polymerase I [Shumkonia mesophila]
MQHVFLIDGSGFIFRAFHALPPMTRPDGTPVNAVYGFTTMILKLIEDTDADYIAVVFDTARRTFRNEIYPDYKAQRPPPPEALIPQFALVREAARAFNVAQVEMEGYEADDLIATYACLAHEKGAKVTIVSSDKDLMQLVGDGITLYDAMRNRVIGPDEVREKFGVGPERVIDVQALAGDSSDNVPGIRGIGVKTAAQLIAEFGDLDTLLARAAEVKRPKCREALIEHAEMARVSRRLVTLCKDVPVTAPLETFVKRTPDGPAAMAFLREQAFRSLIAKLEGRLMAGSPVPAAVGDAPAVIPVPVAAQPRYELVQDETALASWIAAAHATGFVAFDTETTSLDAMTAKLVGVSLAVEPGHACYIPLGHQAPAAQGALDFGGDAATAQSEIRQIPMARAIELLKPLLEDDSVLKIGQNIKYDMQVLANLGVAVAPIDDTMLISYVLDGALHGHGMDELAELLLDHKTIQFKDVAGTGKNKVTFDRVPLEAARDYAAEDADVTLKLYNVLKPRLIAERMVTVYETMDRPLVPVLERMERWGIKVDATELKRLSDDFAGRLVDLEDKIHQLVGRPFNVASPKQLGEVLFEDMGLAGGRKGKTGAYSTDAEVLEALAAEGHDLPARVLDWRQLAKLKSTYTDTLIGQINPRTGRVHTSYAMAATSTGRLASTDPNLQNIPIRTEEGRKIRRAFIAEPGFKLLSADYSQIELRLLAHVAGIEALTEAFHKGLDIHAMTASQVFGVPIEGMDPMVRRKAKAINFGIIYGISAFGLARQLGIPRGEADAYIQAYFARYPGIRDYMEKTKEEARTKGVVATLFGRRCPTPGIADKNPAMRNFAERAAINAPIQGGAADIIKRAMVKLPAALEAANLSARMLLQVHDELVFEVPDAETEATAAVVKAVMEGAAKLDVPLVVDTGIAQSWDEAH